MFPKVPQSSQTESSGLEDDRLHLKMYGWLEYDLGAKGLCSGAFAVSFRECEFPTDSAVRCVVSFHRKNAEGFSFFLNERLKRHEI